VSRSLPRGEAIQLRELSNAFHRFVLCIVILIGTDLVSVAYRVDQCSLTPYQKEAEFTQPVKVVSSLLIILIAVLRLPCFYIVAKAILYTEDELIYR
jgi:hypothetical protein